MNQTIKSTITFITAVTSVINAYSIVINVPVSDPRQDMTTLLNNAIEKAAVYDGYTDLIIRLSPGVYNISRTASIPVHQHISNTTSEQENPQSIKHYGLYLKNLSRITIDGAGATLMTHGEMTAIAIDNCSNITIRDLTIDSADPSVPEMKVISRNDSIVTCRMSARTSCRISADGELYWIGDGWEFIGGIAQIYDGIHTRRCVSPMNKYRYAEQDNDILTFHYAAGEAPECQPGNVYQMRHSLRTEVATFINRSSDVMLSDISYHFLGNFGIVGQFCHTITLDNVVCAPDKNDERTCAGFADFVQMSGCSGKISVRNCHFSGSHDDPINIHGTHLKVVDYDHNSLTVRFMHNQTYGFMPFAAGDEIAAVDACSLRHFATAVVTDTEQLSDYDIKIRLDRDIRKLIAQHKNTVIENVTANPEVEITGCQFSLTPTRGLLLTTSRKAHIANNTFRNIPMSAILIADDGQSWYESGAVRDVTISNNRFIDCASPIIYISPENSIFDGPVHSGIKIYDNEFIYSKNTDVPILVQAKSVEELSIRNNRTANCPEYQITLTGCTSVDIE